MLQNLPADHFRDFVNAQAHYTCLYVTIRGAWRQRPALELDNLSIGAASRHSLDLDRLNTSNDSHKKKSPLYQPPHHKPSSHSTSDHSNSSRGG